MTEVRFLQSARNDLDRERAYYGKIDPALARRFTASVRSAVDALSFNPLAMQIIESEVRRWPVRDFPHGLLYRVEPGLILVLAVFHPKRSPDTWKARAGSPP